MKGHEGAPAYPEIEIELYFGMFFDVYLPVTVARTRGTHHQAPNTGLCFQQACTERACYVDFL